MIMKTKDSVFNVYADIDGMYQVYGILIAPSSVIVDTHQDRYIQEEDVIFQEAIRKVIRSYKTLSMYEKEAVGDILFVWEDGTSTLDLEYIGKQICLDAFL